MFSSCKALRLLGVTLPLIVASACIDNNYDLSDIDTTARVNVDNLILPINIDPIRMVDVVELDQHDIIKVVDGKYTIVQNGIINSSEINIEKITLPAPVIDPSVSVLPNDAALVAQEKGDTLLIKIWGEPVHFSTEVSDVTESVTSISSFKTSATVRIRLTFTELVGRMKILRLRNMILKLPKGLTVSQTYGDYNPATGEVFIPTCTAMANYIDLIINVSEVDAETAGLILNTKDHTAKIEGDIQVVSADMIIRRTDFLVGNFSHLPSPIHLVTESNVSSIPVESFTGTINYKVEGMDIAPVKLTQIPEILRQEGTDISLVNPAIFLSVNYPIFSYGIYANTGLTISAYRSGEISQPAYSLDAPGYFTIGSSVKEYNYNYVMSPTVPSFSVDGYIDPVHVGFKSLQDVLSGNGIPDSLAVSLSGAGYDTPTVPEQHVENFPLGINLGCISGEYAFQSEIQFKDGSTILYTKTEDGWNDEDVDKLTITELEVSAEISSDIPLTLTFTGYPIDKAGNRINDVEIVGAEINANATSQKVTIKITGTITHLDGITFTARAVAPSDGPAITPEMHITLKKIRAKVSGYYETEL